MDRPVEFLRRTLVAVQGGRPLPPDIGRRWERGILAVLNDPKAQLDDEVGIRLGSGTSIAEQYKLQLRDDWVRNLYATHYRHKKKHPASFDIADNLDLLRTNPDDPRIDDCYKELFDRLSAAGIDPPSQGVIYKLLRNG